MFASLPALARPIRVSSREKRTAEMALVLLIEIVFCLLDRVCKHASCLLIAYTLWKKDIPELRGFRVMMARRAKNPNMAAMSACKVWSWEQLRTTFLAPKYPTCFDPMTFETKGKGTSQIEDESI